MAYNATIGRTVSVQDQVAVTSTTVTGEGSAGFDLEFPAALAGTLTTRTDNTTGVITVASHTLTTSDLLDVYFAGGVRRGCTISAVTSTTISFNSGAGDNLPVVNSAVSAQKQVTQPLTFDGSISTLILVTAPAGARAQVSYRTSGGEALVLTLAANASAYLWDGTGTSPLSTASVTNVRASTESATGGRVRGTVLLA